MWTSSVAVSKETFDIITRFFPHFPTFKMADGEEVRLEEVVLGQPCVNGWIKKVHNSRQYIDNNVMSIKTKMLDLIQLHPVVSLSSNHHLLSSYECKRNRAMFTDNGWNCTNAMCILCHFEYRYVSDPVGWARPLEGALICYCDLPHIAVSSKVVLRTSKSFAVYMYAFILLWDICRNSCMHQGQTETDCQTLSVATSIYVTECQQHMINRFYKEMQFLR